MLSKKCGTKYGKQRCGTNSAEQKCGTKSGEKMHVTYVCQTILFCTVCFTFLLHSDLFALEAMCRILVYIANINNCQVVGTHHQMEVQTDY